LFHCSVCIANQDEVVTLTRVTTLLVTGSTDSGQFSSIHVLLFVEIQLQFFVVYFVLRRAVVGGPAMA